MENERRQLKKMPDHATLEEFINGLSSKPKVIFNIEKGELEWINPVTKPRGLNETDGHQKLS